MRRIPIRYLKTDSVIATDVYDSEFRLLIRKNSKINEKTIERLKTFNITSVYIIDEYSNEELEEIIDIELRLKAVRELKNMTLHVTKNKIDIRQDIVVKNEILEEIITTLNEIVDRLQSEDNLLLQQIDIRTIENYNYSHSVNVAIMAVILGIELKYDKEKLKKLALSAMLHDVGKAFIPKELLMKKRAFRTPEEEKLIQTHCNTGYDYLGKYDILGEEIREAVLQHHERIDGSGYPQNLKGNEINEFSKIIALVDFYDNFMASGYMLGDNLPNDILEQIMAYADSAFDYNILRTFFRKVEPFLKGTLVRLNNNDIAIVEGTIDCAPLRPVVKVIESDDEGRIGTSFNLIEKLDLTIVEILYYI